MTHTPEPTPESTPEPVGPTPVGPEPEPTDPDEGHDDDPDSDGMTDMERRQEQLYYSGFGDRVGLDPFAYDSSGNDTGLRESDFI